MRTSHCGRELGQYIGRRGVGYIRRHWDIDLIVRYSSLGSIVSEMRKPPLELVVEVLGVVGSLHRRLETQVVTEERQVEMSVILGGSRVYAVLVD